MYEKIHELESAISEIYDLAINGMRGVHYMSALNEIQKIANKHKSEQPTGGEVIPGYPRDEYDRAQFWAEEGRHAEALVIALSEIGRELAALRADLSNRWAG